jgi:hypothetical protein
MSCPGLIHCGPERSQQCAWAAGPTRIATQRGRRVRSGSWPCRNARARGKRRMIFLQIANGLASVRKTARIRLNEETRFPHRRDDVKADCGDRKADCGVGITVPTAGPARRPYYCARPQGSQTNHAQPVFWDLCAALPTLARLRAAFFRSGSGTRNIRPHPGGDLCRVRPKGGRDRALTANAQVGSPSWPTL